MAWIGSDLNNLVPTPQCGKAQLPLDQVDQSFIQTDIEHSGTGHLQPISLSATCSTASVLSC